VHSGRFAALLEQAGHCTEAVSRFRGVVDHLDSPGFRHDLAYLLRGMGRTDEGEALLRADTRHASRAASLAGFLLDDQRPAEALEVLGPLVARMPWDLALYPVHGDTLSRLGRHDDARETMERLLRLRPDPAKRALFALYLRRSGDLEAAEREARDVLSRDASSSHALEVLGEVALRREDVPAALEAFRVAFEANPKRSGTGFRAVVLLRREGRAAEADAVLASLLEALEQRMEDHPCDPLSGLSYATALATFAPERAREGLSIAREAHRRRPGQRTHAVLARVLHVLGRSKQAVEHARAAADAETEPSAGAAYLLARALAEAGDDEQAREALARGVELDPNYFDRPEIEAEVLGPAHDRKPSSVE
jgi:tetratricopeptide (TPR) repeat protein